jgi:hypothetical protein
MSAAALANQDYQRDLGQGLLVRWSTPEDVERLAAMFADVLRSAEDAPPNHRHAAWVRDMMCGRCPHITAWDFALVEDRGSGRIVAAACLFANRVSYEDLPFLLGRAAIVGTEIPYRNRGLQRAIFDLIHARSAARGHLAQGITGIHYFYRLLGYEYAIDLEASRHLYVAALPSLDRTASAPWALRPAEEADIPLLTYLYRRERACWQVATVMDEQAWHWMLFASDPAAGNPGTAFIITTGDGDPIGYLLVDRLRRGDALDIWGMAVTDVVSLVDVAPYALGALRDRADAFPLHPDTAPSTPLVRFRLQMGPAHALFAALGPHLAPECQNAYAWWMRISDVPAFVRHIAPVLERRLANSAAFRGYGGALCIDFYRDGLRLAFERGKLVSVEEWRKPLWSEGQAGFPPTVFTQLLLGYRGFAELRHIYKDVWAGEIARMLLETLFPPRPSYMLPLY